ncbi:hypothetical protein FRC03_008037 [Tulasnella sp. 419]|nr:hypothetical protein FRC03_008037 [Tulasnella sp. 419]
MARDSPRKEGDLNKGSGCALLSPRQSFFPRILSDVNSMPPNFGMFSQFHSTKNFQSSLLHWLVDSLTTVHPDSQEQMRGSRAIGESFSPRHCHPLSDRVRNRLGNSSHFSRFFSNAEE